MTWTQEANRPLSLLTSRPADEVLGLGAAHLAARSRVAEVLSRFELPTEATPNDERHLVLRAVVRALGEDGVLGGIVASERGGAGMTYSELAAAVEEASAHSQVVASLLAFASASLGTVLTARGTDQQIGRYLLPLLRGEDLAAMGFTEPGGGSDVANMATMAERAGARFVLSGEKVWVDWAPEADWFLVFAQADPEAGRSGITAFLLPRAMPGVETSSMGAKLGFREYTTGRIRLRDCVLPGDAVLGEVGEGLKIARIALEDARVFVAARLCGSLHVALHELRRHALKNSVPRDREEFLSGVTDVAIALDCSRQLMYRAAMLKDAGQDAGKEAMQAKLFASEALGRISTALVSSLGPDALLDTHPAARLFRDAKVSGVTAGSDEVMRGTLARAIVGS
jgi:alkylation response protein AidB-like acyl-CoA dehydrogenase